MAARRFPPVVDLTIALLVAGVVTAVELMRAGDEPALSLPLGCAAAASLAWRRRFPGWTLALSGALTLVLLHLQPAVAAAAVLAPAVALYTLALRRGVLARIVAAAAAVAAIVLTEALHDGRPTMAQTFGHALLVAIPLLVADVHRTRHSNLALLRERLELAERTREQEAQRRAEEERLRIARDLHDVVAHTLTTINVQASTAAELLDRDPAHARGALTTIEEASRAAIDELRAILGILRSGDDDAAPLTPTSGLDDVTELVRRMRDGGVEIRMTVHGDRPSHVPEAVSIAAYRIVQESLTNARRHAAGAPVSIALSYASGRVGIAIENAPGAPGERGPGVGIMGMTERAAALGGTLTAQQVPAGFRVDAELPYARG